MQWRRFLKQLEFSFASIVAAPREGETRSPLRVVKINAPSASDITSPSQSSIHLTGRDHALESQARELLHSLGADKLAREIRVEWNSRLKTCAGRADYRERLISLNPLLLGLDARLAPNESAPKELDRLKRSSFARAAVDNELDRTLRHELAHLLAQWRVGRRRIAPHGAEWRQACRDLGIADEARCHNLPFATKSFSPRYVYRCPNCKEEFPRVRKIRRVIACLACCRNHNHGEFDARFRLKLIT